jgi:hypothetical protein
MSQFAVDNIVTTVASNGVSNIIRFPNQTNSSTTNINFCTIVDPPVVERRRSFLYDGVESICVIPEINALKKEIESLKKEISNMKKEYNQEIEELKTELQLHLDFNEAKFNFKQNQKKQAKPKI